MRRTAYARAGVDVEAGDRAVDLMRAAVAATHGPGVLGGLGGFGAAFAVPAGYREPVLVSATDGVGTKTAIANAVGRFDTIGHDLVAMCADDVVCAGAAPLYFLDYVAVGRLDPVQVGGETAEHPGLMGEDDFDLAGFCVGIVERASLLDGTAARAGDVILGLPSNGLHANGFSLVRALLTQEDIRLDEPYQALVRRTLGDRDPDGALRGEAAAAFRTLGEVLLTPTRIYAPAIVALRDGLAARGSEVHGIAHITGGGLPGNVPRMLGDDLGARLDPSRWQMPSVMRWLGALGDIADDELRAVFNGGLGMVVTVAPEDVDAAIVLLGEHEVAVGVVGQVVDASAIGGSRYSEGHVDG
jgi:phosphoribosylformylglycinamidine cyclo-ligase